MGSSSKSERLAIRIAAADKARLARAAALQRRSVSEFVLATSRETAEHVLGEQTRFRFRLPDIALLLPRWTRRRGRFPL